MGEGTARRSAALAWTAAVSLLLAAVVLSPAALLNDFVGVTIPVALAFVTVGALLGARVPRNPIGWLFAAWGVVMSWMTFATAYVEAGAARAGGMPAGDWIAWSVAVVWHPAFVLLAFILLLFPDGRLPSRRWRVLAWLAPAVYGSLAVASAFSPSAVHLYFPDATPVVDSAVSEAADIVFGALLEGQLGLLLVALVSQLLRLRRTQGVERQQVKWFVYTVVVVVVAFIAGIAVLGAGYLFPLFAAIPAAAAVAILRYRLYDIDRIINRTLVYGVLTVMVGGAYTAGVLLLGQLLSADSELSVAATTLAVVACIRPARRRIQTAIDRRFDRTRYDAAKTIEGFRTRLRHDIDLDALTSELVGVVERTFQPGSASLWLRSPADHR